MATKAKAQIDLPIYLRAKFVGSTHISMPILRILDSVFWLGDTPMGDRGWCGVGRVEAQADDGLTRERGGEKFEGGR
jgi:hypothetical protein